MKRYTALLFFLVFTHSGRLALHTPLLILRYSLLVTDGGKERDMALWLKEQTYCMKNLAVAVRCANFEGHGLMIGVKNIDRDWRTK